MKESLVLLSGCLPMTTVMIMQTRKSRVRATMLHTAMPPCTASTLNTKTSVPGDQERAGGEEEERGEKEEEERGEGGGGGGAEGGKNGRGG